MNRNHNQGLKHPRFAKHPLPPDEIQALMDKREPISVKFEEYLIENLSPSDMYKDNHGMYMFNVDQVAYLVDKCASSDDKRTIQRRMKEAARSISTEPRRCPKSGKGEPHTHTHNPVTFFSRI